MKVRQASAWRTRALDHAAACICMSAGLLAACAAPDAGEARAVRTDAEYVTGSRIPGKGRGTVTSIDKEEVERARSTVRQHLPEDMKP